MKHAVVLFNLGGPDSIKAVEPFLRNLFSDPAIIQVPGFVRGTLARFIAARRAPIAREMYEHMGGSSPILPETEMQARALETVMAASGDTKVFIAMRYWHPFVEETVAAVKEWGATDVTLLPLYPQYSTTTTQSSRLAWDKAARDARLQVNVSDVCCYPTEPGFVAAVTERLREALARAKPEISYRVLFSAHGLPKKIVANGDPYQWQVEQTVAAVRGALGQAIDSVICYQSCVGPLEWIGPPTEAEIERAGAEGKGVIVVPVAFVSEHSETLVELDHLYALMARSSGVVDYIRASTVRDHPDFISGLAALVRTARAASHPVSCVAGRLCPEGRSCGQNVPAKRRSNA